MLQKAVLYIIFTSIFTVTFAVITDETKFHFNLSEWINPSTLEIRWSLDEQLVNESQGFNFVVESNNSKRVLHFPKLQRSAVIENFPNDSTSIKGIALFFSHFALGYEHILWRTCMALYSERDHLFCCSDFLCHDNSTLLVANSKILAICYGASVFEVLVVTESELVAFDLLVHRSVRYHLAIGRDIRTMDYDWLNSLLLILTTQKIYQIRLWNLSVVEVNGSPEDFFRDAVVDPINGFIHILLHTTSNDSLISLPSIISQNTSLSKVTIRSSQLPASYSLLKESHRDSLLILGKNFISDYFLSNSTRISNQVSFDIVSKLQSYEDGYLAWIPHRIYHLNQDKQSLGYKVNVITSDIEYYTNQRSISRDLPSPQLPLQLTSSFFGKDYLLIRWVQPFPKWYSSTRWRKYNYTVSVEARDSMAFTRRVKYDEELLYIKLQWNMTYKVTLSSGSFFKAITGQTLAKDIQKPFRYFVIENGSVRAFEMDLKRFEISEIESSFRGIPFIKGVRLYSNCEFILFENGTIVMKSIEKDKNIHLDLKIVNFEVDHLTGNIIFLTSENQGVYRLRPSRNSTFKVDKIGKYFPKNFAIFPNFNILVVTDSKGRLHFSDLNGEPLSRAVSMEIRVTSDICDKHPVTVIQVRHERRVLSPTEDLSKCIATAMGIITLLKDKISLKNWYGNATLTLLDNSQGASAMAFPEPTEYHKVYVDSIVVESIRIYRINTNDIILSWAPSKVPDDSYKVVLSNLKQNRTAEFALGDNILNITRYGICRDSVQVAIRIYRNSTFGDLVKKTLSIPCISGMASINNIFANKKKYASSKAVLEIRVAFSTNVSTETIDNSFHCRFRIFFEKKSGNSLKNKTIENRLIFCTDNLRTVSMEIDEMSQFIWKRICGELILADLSVIHCIASDILRSDDQNIFFSINQSIVSTYLKEIVRRIYVSLDRASISIQRSDEGARTVLISNSNIFKIEVDWKRNTLFWSQEDNDGMAIFSTYLGLNKQNLLEDRVFWFRTNETDVLWMTNSIERKLFIKLKDREIITNLDYGPLWNQYHGAILECKKLLGIRDLIPCSLTENGVSERIKTSFRGYFVPSRRTIIYEIDEENMCKIQQVQDNYNLPEYIERCLIRIEKSHQWTMKTEAYLSSNKSEYIMVDGDGNVVWNNQSVAKEKVISLNNVDVSITLVCEQHSASLYVYSIHKEPTYRMGISYKQRGTQSEIHLKLLSNYLVDNRRHNISIMNLQPGTRYNFKIVLEDTSSRLINKSDIECATSSSFPDPPQSISITKFNKTYDEIIWTAGNDNGDKVIEYQISIKSSSPPNELFYSTTGTNFGLDSKIKYWFVSIKARNKIGTSFPTHFNISRFLGIRTNSIKSGRHFSMGYSTYLLMIIIIPFCATVVLISIIVHLSKSNRYKALRTIHSFKINEDLLEMKIASQNIKYDVNSLYNLEQFPLSNFDKIPHILNECLTYSHMIGNGAFGMVFKGTMKIETDNSDVKYQPVALKIRNGKSISEDDFKREAVLMFKYMHPNIIELYGVSFDCPDKQCLILEYMEKGNLRQYLQHHRPDVIKRQVMNNPRRKIINENSILDTRDLINIATDILEALKFLEKKNFVHRDIAARNCLVSHQNRKPRVTKLGDFGLARDIYSDEYYKKVSETKLPVRWMAPETIKDGLFTGKSDVWSFGVLCWEIMSFGMDPYMGQANSEVIKDVLAGKHLERPENCPNEFYDIMVQCWKYYPENRPSFSEIDILFQYLDEIKDFEVASTFSRLIIRSYDSSQESEFGKNTDPITEKTSIATTEKYADILSQPGSEHNTVLMQSNYDNLGYEVPTSPSSMSAAMDHPFFLLKDSTNDLT